MFIAHNCHFVSMCCACVCGRMWMWSGQSSSSQLRGNHINCHPPRSRNRHGPCKAGMEWHASPHPSPLIPALTSSSECILFLSVRHCKPLSPPMQPAVRELLAFSHLPVWPRLPPCLSNQRFSVEKNADWFMYIQALCLTVVAASPKCGKRQR